MYVISVHVICKNLGNDSSIIHRQNPALHHHYYHFLICNVRNMKTSFIIQWLGKTKEINCHFPLLHFQNLLLHTDIFGIFVTCNRSRGPKLKTQWADSQQLLLKQQCLLFDVFFIWRRKKMIKSIFMPTNNSLLPAAAAGGGGGVVRRGGIKRATKRRC